MKMNSLESFLMNSSVRAWFLRHVEAPTLLKLSGSLQGKDVLEIGCGTGYGTELLFQLFQANSVLAIDIDSSMIERAQKRLQHRYAGSLELQVGDATALSAADGTFDAVVNLSALHHVPQWQAAIIEIVRVLKPGGRFIFEEVCKKWIERWPYHSLFCHPAENRFSAQEFIEELENQGLIVGRQFTTKNNEDFVFGVAILEA